MIYHLLMGLRFPNLTKLNARRRSSINTSHTNLPGATPANMFTKTQQNSKYFHVKILI